jgi:hypothetical protein
MKDKGALAGPIRSNQGYFFSLADLQGYTAQGTLSIRVAEFEIFDEERRHLTAMALGQGNNRIMNNGHKESPP